MGFLETAKLGIFFLMWYAFNVAYNIYNKKVLIYFPFPWMASLISLGVGLVYLLPVWILGIRAAPKLTGDDLRKLSPVAALHCIGHVMTVIALGAGSVGFVHIVKAAEPLFSTVLNYLINGAMQPFMVNLCLLPVIGGVCMASLTELSFKWSVFLGALGSNTCFASRAIFSKKVMGDFDDSKNLSAANLYGVLTILSFIGLLPFALIVEGPELIAGYNKAIAEVGTTQFYKEQMICGLAYYLYNEVAYMVLGQVGAVTHAVANTVKRVAILVASVIIFGTTMTQQGIIGSSIAIGGVLLYSLTKNAYEAKPKKAAGQSEDFKAKLGETLQKKTK